MLLGDARIRCYAPAMVENLDRMEAAALAELAGAQDSAALEKWRIEYLGTSGKVKAAKAALKDVPREQKPVVGQRTNVLAQTLEGAFKEKQKAIGGAGGAPSGPRVDVTEPGRVFSQGLGRQHVITRVRNELVEVFGRMGFEVAEGPELEDDEHNFVKLNIPASHPARDPMDNFYVDDPAKVPLPRMLRSQTSTVQVRVMEAAVANKSLPVKIVAPGRVYRPDTVDATHSFMFHQIEGLYIDRGVSMADLKSTLFHFARAYFGEGAEVRLRPSYFPFTEPSAEFDIRTPSGEWLELGGCGMVHPNVLRHGGIDPEEWSGFAFGFGIDRMAKERHGVGDLREMYTGDIRFSEQFTS
jgi:phenylalanyl-tRNA synthetase alpha chain